MAGRCYGVTDVETEISHGDAAERALTSLCCLEDGHLAFDAVWSSDLSRCLGLAEALKPGLVGAPNVCVEPRLRELDHGSFEGRLWDEIHATEPAALERWGARWQSEGPPRGESAEALERRVQGWFEALDGSKRHLLVGHAGAMRAALVLCQGLNWPEAMSVQVPHLTAMRIA